MANPHTQTCPIAGFLNLFGDAWTLLIIREAFYGVTRFSAFQRNTGIAKNLLSQRLSSLVNEGLFERENIGERGKRYAYRLSQKGQTLVPVFVAMIQWSNQHIYGVRRAPVELIERETLKPIGSMRPVSMDGVELNWRDILMSPGPGANKAARRRIGQSVYGADEISRAEGSTKDV